jgi:hypothetical protein
MKYLQLTIFLLFVFAQNAYATRWYTVEVIIFANSSNAGVQEELWPEDPGVPDTSNAVSLVSVGAETLPGRPIEFQRLPMKILANSLAAMKRSSRYRVLQASAWRLPGLPLKSAPPVLIQAGKRYLPDGQITTRAPAAPTAASIDPLFDNNAANALPSVLHELEGRIRISLTRFLDVDTDLLYRSNVSLPDSTGGFVNEFRSFRLTEFRRMKSNTIHYIDHPMFGMVIAIDRYGQADSQ